MLAHQPSQGLGTAAATGSVEDGGGTRGRLESAGSRRNSAWEKTARRLRPPHPEDVLAARPRTFRSTKRGMAAPPGAQRHYEIFCLPKGLAASGPRRSGARGHGTYKGAYHRPVLRGRRMLRATGRSAAHSAAACARP